MRVLGLEAKKIPIVGPTPSSSRLSQTSPALKVDHNKEEENKSSAHPDKAARNQNENRNNSPIQAIPRDSPTQNLEPSNSDLKTDSTEAAKKSSAPDNEVTQAKSGISPIQPSPRASPSTSIPSSPRASPANNFKPTSIAKNEPIATESGESNQDIIRASIAHNSQPSTTATSPRASPSHTLQETTTKPTSLGTSPAHNLNTTSSSNPDYSLKPATVPSTSPTHNLKSTTRASWTSNQNVQPLQSQSQTIPAQSLKSSPIASFVHNLKPTTSPRASPSFNLKPATSPGASPAYNLKPTTRASWAPNQDAKPLQNQSQTGPAQNLKPTSPIASFVHGLKPTTTTTKSWRSSPENVDVKPSQQKANPATPGKDVADVRLVPPSSSQISKSISSLHKTASKGQTLIDAENEDIPWDERQELLQRKPEITTHFDGSREQTTASEGTAQQAHAALDNMHPQTDSQEKDAIEEENTRPAEPLGLRPPKEDYTKSPPNFKVAKTNRRKKDLDKPDVGELDVTADPKGKRLPGCNPPPRKTEDCPKDCDGLEPNDSVYRLKPPPVDTPGIRHGEVPLENKLELMKQQVALTEQVEKSRKMKEEAPILTTNAAADNSKRIRWPKATATAARRNVRFDKLDTNSLPEVGDIIRGDIDKFELEEEQIIQSRLSWWKGIREALQDHMGTNENGDILFCSNQTNGQMHRPHNTSAKQSSVEEGDDDESQPFDEVPLRTKPNIFPAPTISAVLSNSYDRSSPSQSLAMAPRERYDPGKLPAHENCGAQSNQNIFRERPEPSLSGQDISSLETEAIKELELEKSRLEAHLIRLIVTKGLDGAAKEQEDEIDRWRRILQAATL